VRTSLAHFQSGFGGQVDQIAKNKDFTEALLEDVFGDGDDEDVT
jgi:hypothetical protein